MMSWQSGVGFHKAAPQSDPAVLLVKRFVSRQTSLLLFLGVATFLVLAFGRVFSFSCFLDCLLEELFPTQAAESISLSIYCVTSNETPHPM